MSIKKQKSVLLIISIILMISFTNAAITGVVQSGKTITITYSPMTMIWFNNELRLAGVPINIMPYCKAMYGWSPLICNLPSVPACDQIRLYGTPGIGTLNLEFLYPFNCTVVA
ncbi:hypothetical protein CYY_009836 [Polysphondylium violaceum]|uniref:Uncharacterized protein n=1 Tax=Polysphondylium violaceum TaxID=133409 RepID=A0A8J4PMA2_9MYCE|nr:hypothetical protein CYY_009836 [Polysphondylium violaceum]